MREYIKPTSEAAEMCFTRGNDYDYRYYEALIAYNEGIATRVFNAIMAGIIDYAYQRSGKRMIVITRSTRGNFVQVTHFAEIDGEMGPTSHGDIYNGKALVERFFEGEELFIEAA